MAETFEPGDVVQLRSGGPKMTVKKVEPDSITCDWFAGSKSEWGFFLPVQLQKASGAKPSGE